uniref:Cation-transporting P-type ATPase C-terminal domain-containing protein n=1 Tax=Chromera velia CCMP2878 TaxID=1169474 RepID=A0A0G4HW30_9ALVE|eukprot:Cvel_32485.t1-p1 / transcript=Cvel_32485.t1 / gene=Cvel_32485 / organism=Chromera_velia_CCMP2878 / gene_product=Probable cation-transporting ATPase 13A2, putative / transcript_product=Probable cation-transporting ATPase 13A2, putative / location=Cvel_scaffold5064:1416-1934(-) / protein_length=70 / sequence_SO=supercontig / SO=protein_coding / is_pseudo=false
MQPTRTTQAGKIRMMCFDKTGTLTKDWLDFLGAVPIERKAGGKEPQLGDGLVAPQEIPAASSPLWRFGAL